MPVSMDVSVVSRMCHKVSVLVCDSHMDPVSVHVCVCVCVYEGERFTAGSNNSQLLLSCFPVYQPQP